MEVKANQARFGTGELKNMRYKREMDSQTMKAEESPTKSQPLARNWAWSFVCFISMNHQLTLRIRLSLYNIICIHSQFDRSQALCWMFLTPFHFIRMIICFFCIREWLLQGLFTLTWQAVGCGWLGRTGTLSSGRSEFRSQWMVSGGLFCVGSNLTLLEQWQGPKPVTLENLS